MVYARVCPKRHNVDNGELSARSLSNCLSNVNDSTISLKRGDSYPERRYTFDAIFSESSSQASIFAKAAVPLIDDVLSGFNGTILAYGQTGTGKTYTMAGPALAGLLDGASAVGGDAAQGSSPAGLDVAAMAAESAGIIPRAIMRLFDSPASVEGDPSGEAGTETVVSTHISVAAVQLYCESVQDLLALSDPGAAAPPPGGLSIREDPENGVYIEGTTWVDATTPQAALRVIATAARNRATASTLMNAHSSRSHAIIMLRVERRRVQSLPAGGSGSGGADGVARVSKSSLFLVDLAGSERVGKSGVLQGNGDRFDEARAINLSLSALGNCIAALAARSKGTASTAPLVKGQSKNGSLASLGQVHVPYRDSKLTRLLQDSLGGNARTALIVTLTPDPSSASETGSTLEFGARAAQVAVHARKNETLDYKALYQALKSQLASPAPSLPGSMGQEAPLPRARVEQLEVQIDTLKQQLAALEGDNANLRGRLAAALELNKPAASSSDPRPPSGGHLPSGLPTPPSTASGQGQAAVQATGDALAIVQGLLGTIASSDASFTTVASLSAPLAQLRTFLQGQSVAMDRLTQAHSAGMGSMQSKHRVEVGKAVQERDSARESLSLVQQDLLGSLSSLRALQSHLAQVERESNHAKGRLTDTLDELTQVRSDKEQALARAAAAECEAESLRDRLRRGVGADGSSGEVRSLPPGGGRTGSWAEVETLYESSLRSLQGRVAALEARSAAESSRNEELAYALRLMSIQRQREEEQAEEAEAQHRAEAEERHLASLALHSGADDDILVMPNRQAPLTAAAGGLAGSISLAVRTSSSVKAASSASAVSGRPGSGVGAAGSAAVLRAGLQVIATEALTLDTAITQADHGKPPTPTVNSSSSRPGSGLRGTVPGNAGSSTSSTPVTGSLTAARVPSATVAPSSAVTSSQLAMKNAQLLGLSSGGSFRLPSTAAVAAPGTKISLAGAVVKGAK